MTYEVHPDVKMHRKRTMTHILDETGDPVWSGSNTFEAFEHMLEISQHHFKLVWEDRVIRVMIGRITY